MRGWGGEALSSPLLLDSLLEQATVEVSLLLPGACFPFPASFSTNTMSTIFFDSNRRKQASKKEQLLWGGGQSQMMMRRNAPEDGASDDEARRESFQLERRDSYIPEWVSDAASLECMGCNREFTIRRRRHHVSWWVGMIMMMMNNYIYHHHQHHLTLACLPIFIPVSSMWSIIL